MGQVDQHLIKLGKSVYDQHSDDVPESTFMNLFRMSLNPYSQIYLGSVFLMMVLLNQHFQSSPASA